MKVRHLHDWNVAYKEAAAIQQRLRRRLSRHPPRHKIRTVAGADVGYDRAADRFYAGVLVMRFDSLEVIEQATAVARPTFPYIPGLLSFREAPPLLAALAKLTVVPSVMFFDGQGIAHPRRLGLAAHMGLLVGRPSVGVAKSRLCGTHAEPGPRRGDWADLTDGEEIIGRVLRTRDGVRPLYVSIGHRMDLPTACRLVLACYTRYRQPEPTRLAHHLVTRLRKEAAGKPAHSQ